MAQHRIVRFTRHDSIHLTDEYRTDEPVPHTLGYVDHHGNGTVDVYVSDFYADRSRFYTNRPTSRGLAIMERHLDRMGYKNCLEFQDLTAGAVPGKV